MHTRSGLAFSTILLALILLTVHYLGMRFYIYWSVSWYDLVVHCLGGITVAFVATLFAEYLWNKRLRLKSVFFITLFVAICWEIYEYIFGLSGASGHYWTDTLSDILMGFIGSIIGVYVIRLFFAVKNEQSTK